MTVCPLDALANCAEPRDTCRRSDDGSIVLTSFGVWNQFNGNRMPHLSCLGCEPARHGCVNGQRGVQIQVNGRAACQWRAETMQIVGDFTAADGFRRDATASFCRLAHLVSMFKWIAGFGHLFSCAGRSLAFASRRLGEYRYLSDPTNVREGRGIMHSLDVYHLACTKPEVITLRAPATECLHARVARMRLLYESHPRTPIAVRWCLR